MPLTGTESQSQSESESDEMEAFKWPFDQQTLDKWMQMDHNETSPPTTDEAIVQEVQGQDESDDESDEDANDVSQLSVAQPVSNEQARDAMDCLNRFLMQREVNERDQSIHYQFKAMVNRMTVMNPNLKQSEMTTFFKKSSERGDQGPAGALRDGDGRDRGVHRAHHEEP